MSMRAAGAGIVAMVLMGAAAIGQAPAAAVEAQSKTVPTEVITAVTLESVQKRIQAMGFDCTRPKDEKGQDKTYVIFQAEGFKVIVFVPSATTVEMDTIFDDVHPSLETVNAWNRDNRFSRAYIEKDGSADLEDDLDLAAGVTAAGFENYIKTFRNSVGRWAHYVVEHEDKKPAAGN